MLDIRDHGGLFGGVNRNKYKRWASGSVYQTSIGGTSTLQFLDQGNVAHSLSFIQVTGLDFIPSTVVLYKEDNGWPAVAVNTQQIGGNPVYIILQNVTNTYYKLVGNAYVDNRGFQLPVPWGYCNYRWIAIE